MDQGLYASLEARLRALERDAAALRSDLTAFAPSARRAAAVVPAQPEQPGPHEPSRGAAASTAHETAATRTASTLETFFAGRGLQLAGLFLVLLGVAFFLNLAFTRGWIGPAERIVLGLVAGAALLAEGARRRRPVDMPVAESLIALGAGILYLSLWAAVAVYPQLHVSRGASFAAMIAVTGVLAVVALTRRAERIALLGLAGGFLTPLLLSSDSPDRAVLAAYLAVLAFGFAAVAVGARFRSVEAAAFAGTALYLPAFEPAAGWSVAAACAVVTMFAAGFALLFSAAARREGAASAARVALLSVDAATCAWMLAIVFDGHATWLGIALLAMSAACLAGARLAPLPAPMRAVYGYAALGAATLALPALLHGDTLLDAVVVEGALLALVGASRAQRVAGVLGATLLALASVWLLIDAGMTAPAHTAFSSIALSFVLTAASLAFLRTQIVSLASERAVRGWARAASAAGNVVVVAGIARILLDALGGQWDNGVPSHAQVAISLAWTAYAAALFGFGMRRASVTLRRQGLVLFAITILKVFAVDLGNVDVAWRIASFVGLGIVCIVLSAWYMRATARGGAQAES